MFTFFKQPGMFEEVVTVQRVGTVVLCAACCAPLWYWLPVTCESVSEQILETEINVKDHQRSFPHSTYTSWPAGYLQYFLSFQCVVPHRSSVLFSSSSALIHILRLHQTIDWFTSLPRPLPASTATILFIPSLLLSTLSPTFPFVLSILPLHLRRAWFLTSPSSDERLLTSSIHSRFRPADIAHYSASPATPLVSQIAELNWINLGICRLLQGRHCSSRTVTKTNSTCPTDPGWQLGKEHGAQS